MKGNHKGYPYRNGPHPHSCFGMSEVALPLQLCTCFTSSLSLNPLINLAKNCTRLIGGYLRE